MSSEVYLSSSEMDTWEDVSDHIDSQGLLTARIMNLYGIRINTVRRFVHLGLLIDNGDGSYARNTKIKPIEQVYRGGDHYREADNDDDAGDSRKSKGKGNKGGKPPDDKTAEGLQPSTSFINPGERKMPSEEEILQLIAKLSSKDLLLLNACIAVTSWEHGKEKSRIRIKDLPDGYTGVEVGELLRKLGISFSVPNYFLPRYLYKES